MGYEINAKRLSGGESFTHSRDDNDLRKAFEEWGAMHGLRDAETGKWRVNENEYRVTVSKYGQPDQVRPLESWLDFFKLR